MPALPERPGRAEPFTEHSAAIATLQQLRGLMDGLNAGLDLDQTMTSVVEGVVSGLGFGVAVISVVQPEQDLKVTAVAGDPAAREALQDSRSPRAEWDRMFGCAQPVGPGRQLRMVVHTSDPVWDETAMPTWVPPPPPVPSAMGGREPWHPMDALFAPLVSPTAGLVGMLSVDLPPDGLRPSEELLGLLEVFAAQASTAVEHARLHTELIVANELARTALAARLQAVIDASPAAIVEVDRAGVVQQWSRSAEILMGHRADEVVGRPFAQHGGRHIDLPGALAWFEAGGDLPVVEMTWTRTDGVVLELEISAAPTRAADGSVVGLMALLVDITARKRLEGQLHQQATHDSLTGLANRSLLIERLSQALSSGVGCTAVLVIDLDRFKDVNNTFGHEYGDQLLVAVGERLAGLLAPGDTLARLAGDEFAVVLTEVHDDETVTATCGHILRELHRPFDLDGVPVDVEVSIGVATSSHCPDPGRDAAGDPEVLLRRADLAMYEAKENSAGIVSYEPARVSPQSNRVALLGELRRALDHGELVMHYQPQVDVTSGRLYGVEALVRWQHPTRGLLSPADFLHVAESTGLVAPLTMQVLDLVCAQLAAWSQTGRVLPVAVNLSARSLHDRGLGDQVRAALDQHQLSPSVLRLEVTESAVMSDPRRALTVLNDLVRSGLQLSLDDFGTGFSSMSHLRELPATELKVDRSFVTHMTQNADDHVLVRSTIDLAHNLGLLVVAEGVEDAVTLDALRRLGCDVAQGYHIARPMPAAALDEWLAGRELRRAS